MAITTPDAVPGQVIEAAWGDAVRADLSTLDINKVAKAGDTMTGALSVGNAPGPNLDGVRLTPTGNIHASSVTVDVSPLNATLQNAAAVNGQMFATFNRTNTITRIGSINIATSSTVAYATTSDKRIKTLTRVVDPGEAVAKIAALEPVNFTFTAYPAEGEQVGFFAQDLAVYAPEAVTVGGDDPNDKPWMVDHSKLVPTLVAAIQALTRRIEQLEAA